MRLRWLEELRQNETLNVSRLATVPQPFFGGARLFGSYLLRLLVLGHRLDPFE